MLPSRADFFKTGLAPASSIEYASQEECIICASSYTNPISITSCKHAFCKDCITQWLTQPQKNSCPICRRPLFALPSNENGPVQGDRMVVMGQAMTHAGLLGGEYMRFSDNIHINISELYCAAAQANLWLGEQHHTAAAGAAIIDRQNLGHHIIAMGNLLRGYAHAMGRPYTRSQRRDWRVLAKALYEVISKWDGRTMDAVLIARQLRGEMQRYLVLGGFMSESFFENVPEPQSLAADLDILLAYIANKAAEHFAAREAIRTEIRTEQSMWRKVSVWWRGLVSKW